MMASVLAVFAACKPAPKYTLTDGEWMMVAMTDNEGAETMITQNRPTMKFTEELTVHGMAGCNNFMGKYTPGQEEGAIKIDLGGMTMKMCLDMTVENRMVRMIPRVTAYQIDGNQLLLFNKDGMELFRFDNVAIPEENQ